MVGLLLSGCQEKPIRIIDMEGGCEERCQLVGVHANQLYEVSARQLYDAVSESCANGIDDDGNGLTDCGDASCEGLASCRAPSAREETPTPRHKRSRGAACKKRRGCEVKGQERFAEGNPFESLFSDNDPIEHLRTIQRSNTPSKTGPSETSPQALEESGDIVGPGEQELLANDPASRASASKKERTLNTLINDQEGLNLSAQLGKTQRRIQSCYERELTNNEDLQGKISLDFVLSQAGKVTRVDFTADTLLNQNVNTCIRGVFKRLKLPAPEQELTASISFIFSSK